MVRFECSLIVNKFVRACKTMLVIAFKKIVHPISNTVQIYYMSPAQCIACVKFISLQYSQIPIFGASEQLKKYFYEF